MNIDFPPPSKGTYNNANSSRQLANYLEHEDMERMQKGIYTEEFFNLTDNDLYKAQIINPSCSFSLSKTRILNKTSPVSGCFEA